LCFCAKCETKFSATLRALLMIEHGEQRENDDDADWVIAQRRADVLRRLLRASDPGARSKLIALAASELAISRATVYRLLARFQMAEVASALLPSRRGRPQGARSLDRGREAIIAHEISRFYLKSERPRLSHLIGPVAIQPERNPLGLRAFDLLRARERACWRTLLCVA